MDFVMWCIMGHFWFVTFMFCCDKNNLLEMLWKYDGNLMTISTLRRFKHTHLLMCFGVLYYIYCFGQESSVWILSCFGRCFQFMQHCFTFIRLKIVILYGTHTGSRCFKLNFNIGCVYATKSEYFIKFEFYMIVFSLSNEHNILTITATASQISFLEINTYVVYKCTQTPQIYHLDNKHIQFCKLNLKIYVPKMCLICNSLLYFFL